MRKERLLRYGIYCAGIISLALFIITKNEVLLDALTQNMFTYGDLYRFTKVREFRVDLPTPVESLDGFDIADGDTSPVIIIGDSFMETCRGHQPFPELLSARLQTDVSVVYAGHAPEYFDPVYVCWKHNLKPQKNRIILLERIERYIINDYLNTYGDDTASLMQEEHDHRQTWWETAEERYFTEAERTYEVFLSSSDITSPVVEAWNTFRFNVLRQISDETPRYSLHPHFLFYKEETQPGLYTSFYYQHSDKLVQQIADNIAEMADDVKARYNAQLVFMPIPNAYTLYHTLINHDAYDNFLPRLYRELKKRNVPTVELYDLFRSTRQLLFFPTDTHWNAEGARLAVDQASALLTGINAEGF